MIIPDGARGSVETGFPRPDPMQQTRPATWAQAYRPGLDTADQDIRRPFFRTGRSTMSERDPSRTRSAEVRSQGARALGPSSTPESHSGAYCPTRDGIWSITNPRAGGFQDNVASRSAFDRVVIMGIALEDLSEPASRCASSTGRRGRSITQRDVNRHHYGSFCRDRPAAPFI